MSSFCACCKTKDDKPTIDADIHDNNTQCFDCDHNTFKCCVTINNICKNDIEDLEDENKKKIKLKSDILTRKT
jgi:hypothetical protein